MRRTAIWIVIVVIALILLGIGWYFFVDQKPSSSPASLSPVTTTDHILGDPAAPIVFVEYCDIESPYCRSFQTVMENVIAAYGKNGSVAWVYRHLPLTDQYANAEELAEASECVGALGGTNTFFKFIDTVAASGSADGLSGAASYAPFITPLGIDSTSFASCLASQTYAPLVAAQTKDALSAGASGAPYTVVFIEGHATIPIQGAFSYSQMQQLIDTLLAKVPAS
ncbi:MAG TPA: thioredoxin domain-containing protein [Candidatus Paceibacterota bacterium]|nr:thioredoxin domain-containing protein [Candidatus Paceibacterota bacterium]